MGASGPPGDGDGLPDDAIAALVEYINVDAVRLSAFSGVLPEHFYGAPVGLAGRDVRRVNHDAERRQARVEVAGWLGACRDRNGLRRG